MEFFFSRPWLDFLHRHFVLEAGSGVAASSRMVIFGVEDEVGNLRMLMPASDIASGRSPFSPRVVATVAHFESFSPLFILFDPDVENRLEILTGFFRRLRHGDPESDIGRFDVIRVFPVLEQDGEVDILYTALRQAGFRVQTYSYQANFYESTVGISHEAYFAARSTNTRYNTRRRLRNLEKIGDVAFELVTDLHGLTDRILEEYVEVSLASWKDMDTMVTESLLDLIRLTARLGIMRLGIMRLDGAAIAVQFWVVSGGTGHTLRLAYREDFRKYAPGVVLTNHMIRHVIDEDHVEEISYGIGGEDYKKSWMKDERTYFGLVAFNTGSPRGVVNGAVHILGRPVKQFIKNLLGRDRDTEQDDRDDD